MIRKIFLAVLPFLMTACSQYTGTDNTHSVDSAVAITDSSAASHTSTSMPAGPVANTVMTEAYVKSVASFAYLWAWPMENIHNRRAMFENVPAPGYMGGIVPIAPINQIGMLTDYIAPEERLVACPNQDVVYGFAMVDFSVEPVIVQVPDFGDRFWVYQICDQRTDGFASVGKMYNTKPGFYLLTGKGWNGKVPTGIEKTFVSSTTLAAVIPRAFVTDDPADKQAIQSVLKQIMVYPLSKFDGKMKSVDWAREMKIYPADKSSGSEETKWVRPETFFDELPAILKEVPPIPGEEAWYGQMHSVLDAAAKDPKVKNWLNAAALEADQKMIPPLFQFVNVGYPVKSHWTTQKNGAEFGTDYLTRTSCAKANIFVNKPNETKYFYQDLDSSGTRLDGNKKYTVSFAKGNIPPVKGFWSVTLYNQHHFFSPNAQKRYSLGTKNKNLQYNADGSLTLYVQNSAPDASKMNNWLPAPKEPFSLYVRCYWPDETVLTGEWNPPPVVKVK